jgi:hypothetical protein
MGKDVNLNFNDTDIEDVGRVNYLRIFSSASTCIRDLISATRIKKILEVGGSSGLHSLENSVWKRLWTCHKTDYYLNLRWEGVGVIGGVGYGLVMCHGRVIVQPILNEIFKYWIIRFA